MAKMMDEKIILIVQIRKKIERIFQRGEILKALVGFFMFSF